MGALAVEYARWCDGRNGAESDELAGAGALEEARDGPWYDFEGDVPSVVADGECGRDGGGGNAVDAVSGASSDEADGAEDDEPDPPAVMLRTRECAGEVDVMGT